MTDSTTTTTTTATNKPDLLDCDALMLSSYLLHHRFDGDAMATATFLLEATSTLPNAESLSAQLLGTTSEQDENMNTQVVATAVSTDTATIAASANLMGNALARECAVSMTQPRGRFTMTLHENGIRFVNAKNQVLSISPNSVEYLALFPKPEDCRATSKPSGGDMVLLTLDASTASFNDKALTQVCFQLAKEPPSTNETWLDVMSSSLSLERHQVAIVPNPKFKTNHSVFTFESHDEGTTSSTTAGMPYVQCYHGVKDGVLFPMQQGLLFFKPPMFLHRSTLHSIACGRGSGASSRYVDLSIVLDDTSPIEFTNIHRDELVHLNDYIHSTLIPAMKRDALPSSNHDVENVENRESEDDSTLGKRKRVQRKASKEARQATKAHMERTQEEDSEDDDDDGWEGKEEEEEEESDDEEEEAAMAVDGSNNDEDDDDDDDEVSEDEFFEEQASGSATESDDDD